jgi:hypothetical protein
MTSPLLRHSLLVCALAGVVAAGAGCAYRPGRGPAKVDPLADNAPAWVRNPPLDPSIIYASGGVAGNDREGAIADARKNLAAQLHIVIDGDTAAVRDDDTPDLQRPAELHLKSLDLPNVRVNKLEYIGNVTYVLLAFDRSAWADQLRPQIATLDARIRDGLVHPPVATNRIAAAAKRYQLLRPLVQQRDELFARLLVADPNTTTGPAAVSVERLRNDLAGVLAGLSANVVVDGSLDAVQGDLYAALAGLGLRANPGIAGDLTVNLALRSGRSSVDGMERIEGSFTVEVRNSAERRLLGSLDVRLRASATANAVASDRLNQKVVERWREYLDDGFVDCLTRY